MCQEFDAFYAKNIGLVRKVAYKVHTRLSALGAAVQLQDVEQEASIAMMKAWDSFDEERGFKFSTYYYRAAMNNLNKFVDSYQKDATVLGVFSMSAAVNEDGDELGGEGTIDGHHGSPEEYLEAKQLLEDIRLRLSPLAYKMVELKIDPPESLLREWEIGLRLKSRSVEEISMTFIGDFLSRLLPLQPCEIRNARQEIIALGNSFHA